MLGINIESKMKMLQAVIKECDILIEALNEEDNQVLISFAQTGPFNGEVIVEFECKNCHKTIVGDTDRCEKLSRGLHCYCHCKTPEVRAIIKSEPLY